MWEICTLSVNKVNYHKFSHCAASYMLNGKNVNVMLESLVTKRYQCSRYQELTVLEKDVFSYQRLIRKEDLLYVLTLRLA